MRLPYLRFYVFRFLRIHFESWETILFLLMSYHVYYSDRNWIQKLFETAYRNAQHKKNGGIGGEINGKLKCSSLVSWRILLHTSFETWNFNGIAIIFTFLSCHLSVPFLVCSVHSTYFITMTRNKQFTEKRNQ